MFSSSPCPSPKIPGAWLGVDATSGRTPRVSSRLSALSHVGNDARFLPGPAILPKKYDKSEKLHLELWDPHRLAAHVMATLSAEDERAAAVDFILEHKITGAFLARYTYEVDAIFEDAHENTEIIRSIARTIPQIFWIKPYQPPTSRYSLREVVKEIRASTNPICSSSTTKHGSPFLVSDWVEQEEVVELVSLDPVDSASDGVPTTSDGRRPEFGARRMWGWIHRTVYLTQSTFEDWGTTFTFLSGLIRAWRDGNRENDSPQMHEHSSPPSREPYSSRTGAGMGDRSNEDYL